MVALGHLGTMSLLARPLVSSLRLLCMQVDGLLPSKSPPVLCWWPPGSGTTPLPGGWQRCPVLDSSPAGYVSAVREQGASKTAPRPHQEHWRELAKRTGRCLFKAPGLPQFSQLFPLPLARPWQRTGLGLFRRLPPRSHTPVSERPGWGAAGTRARLCFQGQEGEALQYLWKEGRKKKER